MTGMRSRTSPPVMSGKNLPLVGKLLGHRRDRTTTGYPHLADGHLVEAAETVRGIPYLYIYISM